MCKILIDQTDTNVFKVGMTLNTYKYDNRTEDSVEKKDNDSWFTWTLDNISHRLTSSVQHRPALHNIFFTCAGVRIKLSTGERSLRVCVRVRVHVCARSNPHDDQVTGHTMNKDTVHSTYRIRTFENGCAKLL